MLGASSRGCISRAVARWGVHPGRLVTRAVSNHPGWPFASGASIMTTALDRPTHLEVDYEALAQNYVALRENLGPSVRVLPTLKADAYGHGAVSTAFACIDVGADYLAVAALCEAVELRNAGVSVPILVMSYVPSRFVSVAADLDITVAVYDADVLKAYETELAGSPRLKVHMKVDSGMGRLGAMPEDAIQVGRLMFDSRVFAPEGIMTHFSSADDNLEYTQKQVETFMGVVNTLKDQGCEFQYRHCGNSAASMLGPEYCIDMARTGIALYGCVPSSLRPKLPSTQYALTWKSEVAQVKTLPAGHPVGYNNTYITSKPEKVAMVPVGYGDGYRRGPSNPGHLLIGGTKCPIRGRVSMEKTMVCVDHLADVAIGDEVVLLGKQGDEHITPESMAAAIGSNNYEVLTSALPRVRKPTPL